MTDTALRYPGAYLDTPDKPALVMSETGQKVTFAELDESAWRIARFLRDAGVEVGGHVALCMENRAEYVIAHHGAHYAGAYYTLVSTRLTPAESAYIIRDCGAKVVVVSDQTLDGVLAGLGDEPGPLVVTVDIARSGVEALATLSGCHPATPLADAVDGSEMLYSSGTTGRPKGVRPPLPGTPLGTTNLAADLAKLIADFDRDTVYLSPAPYYHSAPCKWSQAAIASGGTVVMMPRFDAQAAVEAIDRYDVTHSQWVPTMFQRMLRLPLEVRQQLVGARHRVAIHAAAPCPVEVKRQMIEWWGPILHEFYASTEAIGLVHCTTDEWLDHPGTVGHALFGEVRILDDEGRQLGPGEVGTVSFVGGRKFEYHNDPGKTSEAYINEDTAAVGDVGYLDADGFLFLTDRKSHMIITGGVNVYPQETENLLSTHHAVRDVAVIGVPNQDFGEEVRAIVELEESATASDDFAAELIAFCREHLADVKCPRRIDFRTDLPREPTGKLLKRKLRDEYWAGRESNLV